MAIVTKNCNNVTIYIGHNKIQIQNNTNNTELLKNTAKKCESSTPFSD